MRTFRVLMVLGALFVLFVGRASAQQDMRFLRDPSGWFSISLPSDWRPAADPAQSLGAGFIHGFSTSSAGTWVRSTLAAEGPDASNGYAVPFIGMLALELPQTVSARQFGKAIKTFVPSGWTRTQEGDTRIAGFDASYQYVTRGELYAVLVGIPTPRATYLIMAGTLNQPERVNADFATIAQILDSLHPR